MIPEKNKLNEILEKSIKYVENHFSNEVENIDHASYQTVDKKEYKSLFEKINADNKLIKEIQYSGRNLSVFELSEPIKINDRFTLKRIEIEEPKPGSTIVNSYWESVSYKVNDLDTVIEKNSDTDKELKKIRQVGNDKYGYIIFDDYRIQLRNNFFCIEESSSSEESTQSEKDYKSMFEEEKEKRLRVLADMDNEKKRMEKQKEEFIRLANVAIVKDLFDIVDDLNRASQDDSNKESIKMIFNKLLGILNNYGVIPLDAKKGDDFNPSFMEAISTVPGDDKEKNKLIHIEQIGFKHKDDDRILRPCRVIVGK